jgi:hypothetical protein
MQPKSHADKSARAQRRSLHAAVRYAVIALAGVAVAGLSFYLLRKLGY